MNEDINVNVVPDSWKVKHNIIKNSIIKCSFHTSLNLFLETIRKTNKLIMSAQKKNWQISAIIESVRWFFRFFAKDNTLIMPLKYNVKQSTKTKNKINGKVIKNINPMIHPMIKIKT